MGNKEKEQKRRESIAFLQIPKALFANQQFKDISVGAKLLYGILLDRTSLSAVNGWKDSRKRIFVYYTIDSVGQILGCSNKKAMKLLKEIETKGLIERHSQGQGKPDRILVKKMIEEECEVGSN